MTPAWPRRLACPIVGSRNHATRTARQCASATDLDPPGGVGEDEAGCGGGGGGGGRQRAARGRGRGRGAARGQRRRGAGEEGRARVRRRGARHRPCSRWYCYVRETGGRRRRAPRRQGGTGSPGEPLSLSLCLCQWGCSLGFCNGMERCGGTEKSGEARGGTGVFSDPSSRLKSRDLGRPFGGDPALNASCFPTVPFHRSPPA